MSYTNIKTDGDGQHSHDTTNEQDAARRAPGDHVDWEPNTPAYERYQEGRCVCGERLFATLAGPNCFNCNASGGLQS